eukprot:scaffold1803_cov92-Amphora_coffeaeformis.AAC.9
MKQEEGNGNGNGNTRTLSPSSFSRNKHTAARERANVCATLYGTILWYGMVWYGMVYGIVLYCYEKRHPRPARLNDDDDTRDWPINAPPHQHHYPLSHFRDSFHVVEGKEGVLACIAGPTYKTHRPWHWVPQREHAL